MNERQQYACSLVHHGRNIFVTGGAGTGKTFFIKEIVRQLRQNQKNVGVTSMTANSALLIHGQTLHSFLGIGIAKDTQSMMTRVRKFRKINTWKSLDVLIIDEVSMLSKLMFESLDYIAKEFIQNPRPFGGIQLVLCGDFCQLGCIDTKEFCFESSLWSRSIHETVEFTHIFRQQSDEQFSNLLEHMRFGCLLDDEKEALVARQVEFDPTNMNGIEPTRLYPYRKDVQAINESNLSTLIMEKKERVMTYHVRSLMKKSDLQKLCPELALTLCTNAQVILTVNLDMEDGLVNGSRGVVKGFSGVLPIVQFVNGMTRVIDYYTYSMDEEGDAENKKKGVSYAQIPLMLGWAITIHKSQGMTLDYVITDLSKVFDYGQAYVTLSRVRNLKNLWIQGINFPKIQCNPVVREFYQQLRKKQKKLSL